ncbi:MAG: ABC transporter ATP-binding protein [Elusimicrobiota bacterium]
MLEVIDLHCGYFPGADVLRGICLAVNPKQIIGVIGANGAGKTTLLKTISGLIKPTDGEIKLKNVSIKNKKPSFIARRGVAHIPEGRRIFADLTIYENLILGGYNVKSSTFRENLESVFSLFPQLKERLRQKAGTLSGGEQQMLAIARGLVSGPEIILLDEPSMGLSPILVDRIFELIKELRNTGRTILLVEQIATKTMEVADEIYLLETGQFVISGRPSDLKNNPLVKKTYLGG